MHCDTTSNNDKYSGFRKLNNHCQKNWKRVENEEILSNRIMLSYSSQENGLVLVERCSIPAIDIIGWGGEGRMIEVAGRMQYYLMVTVVGQDKSVKTFFQQLTLKICNILYSVHDLPWEYHSMSGTSKHIFVTWLLLYI